MSERGTFGWCVCAGPKFPRRPIHGWALNVCRAKKSNKSKNNQTIPCRHVCLWFARCCWTSWTVRPCTAPSQSPSLLVGLGNGKCEVARSISDLFVPGGGTQLPPELPQHCLCSCHTQCHYHCHNIVSWMSTSLPV